MHCKCTSITFHEMSTPCDQHPDCKMKCRLCPCPAPGRQPGTDLSHHWFWLRVIFFFLYWLFFSSNNVFVSINTVLHGYVPSQCPAQWQWTFWLVCSVGLFGIWLLWTVTAVPFGSGTCTCPAGTWKLALSPVPDAGMRSPMLLHSVTSLHSTVLGALPSLHSLTKIQDHHF